MKIVLIQPPIQDFYDTNIRLQPLGLAYLKATIQKYLHHKYKHEHKIETIIRDFHSHHGRRTVAIPKELRYLKDYYAYPDDSPFCSFHNYYHFGASYEKIAAEVVALNPSLIGISSLFTPYFREVLCVAHEIKKYLPSVPIVVGGSHVSAVPERVLKHDDVDYIIRGEGERPFVELLEYLLGIDGRTISEVSNLGYKDPITKKIHLNPITPNYPFDELPIPDFSDFSEEKVKKKYAFITTSRSCPHHCSFCSVHLTFGNKFRTRKTQNVLDEIQQRYQEGYRIIDFEDDNLTFNKQQMISLCDGLIALFPEQQMEFVAMNGVSYLSLDQEILTLMRKANFTELNIALVSTNNSTQDRSMRPHSLQKYLDVIKLARELKFQITSYQILGLPYESLEEMIQTLIFGASLPVLLGCSPFYLTPNSPIAKSDFPSYQDTQIDEEEHFKSRLTAFYPPHPHCSREELYTLFITTRIINFLKSSRSPITDREQLGHTLLQKLLTEKKLYYHHKNHFYPNNKFNSSLFFNIWHRLNEGKDICSNLYQDSNESELQSRP